MGNTRFRNQTSMEDKRGRRSIQSDGKFPCSRFRRYIHRKSYYYYRNAAKLAQYIFPIGVLLASPVYANNTISSPSSSSSGTVINNGYQSISGGYPTHRYSNGIQCQLPTIGINPFITKGRNFSLPKYNTVRNNIYDLSEDDSGNLINPGSILYTTEQPRIDQTTYNINYGITASIQIPLGGKLGFNKECLKAAVAHRKSQEFILEAKKLEVNLNRLKICAEQFKLGVKFIGDDAVSCRNVVLTTVPNQVLPHQHSLTSENEK